MQKQVTSAKFIKSFTKNSHFQLAKGEVLGINKLFYSKKSDKKEIVEEVSFSNNKIMKSKKQHQLILFIKVDKI